MLVSTSTTLMYPPFFCVEDRRNKTRVAYKSYFKYNNTWGITKA